MFRFGGGGGNDRKATAKEQAKATKKSMKKGQREIDREFRQLERDERRVQAEIKKEAKRGNMDAARMMAKELVRLRAAKTKLRGMSSHMGAMGVRATTMAAGVAMADTMGSAAQVMAKSNAAMNPQKMQATMRQFAKQSEIMNMTDAMMDDALADAFEDDSEEEDLVVSQVLDEIGVDLDSMMADAPSRRVATAAPEAKDTAPSDAEVEAMMRSLGVAS